MIRSLSTPSRFVSITISTIPYSIFNIHTYVAYVYVRSKKYDNKVTRRIITFENFDEFRKINFFILLHNWSSRRMKENEERKKRNNNKEKNIKGKIKSTIER